MIVSYELRPADPATFTGEVHMVRMATASAAAPTHIYYVRFSAGARTHWHSHTGTQMLLVQEGRCLLQRGDAPVETYEAGSAIRIPPGQRHWHGADASGVMVHVAINLDSERTDWEGPASL